jgi:hypothetical protein
MGQVCRFRHFGRGRVARCCQLLALSAIGATVLAVALSTDLLPFPAAAAGAVPSIMVTLSPSTIAAEGRSSTTGTATPRLAGASQDVNGSLLSLVTMRWTFYYTPTYTEVLALVLNGAPAGATVLVTCHGRGCPFTRHIAMIRPRVDLTGVFQHHRLRAGARVTVAITRPGWTGKYYMFAMRAGHAPRVQLACLAPGRTHPGGGCSTPTPPSNSTPPSTPQPPSPPTTVPAAAAALTTLISEDLLSGAIDQHGQDLLNHLQDIFGSYEQGHTSDALHKLDDLTNHIADLSRHGDIQPQALPAITTAIDNLRAAIL